jgi:predicted component of type VI protein secretion system
MIPVRLNCLYFQIDLSGQIGEAVRREKSLSVYAPPAFDRVEMELIIVAPKAPGQDL